LIGSAVVFHVPSFWKELTALEEKGLKGVRERIFVSDRCQINFDLHAAVDGLEEIELGSNAVGTTKRGIGPAYSTKAARSGVRIHEIFDEETFERKLRLLASGYKKRFGDLLKYDVEEEIEKFKQYRVELAPYVVDAVAFMKQAQEQDRSILIEGGQALMLDIDYGTYPYVTSSNAGLGGCVTGLALNPRKISEIIGVVKAYSELHHHVGSKIPTVGVYVSNAGQQLASAAVRSRRRIPASTAQSCRRLAVSGLVYHPPSGSELY
jgi:adenylosuccinate synthase